MYVQYVDNKIKGHCYLVHTQYGGIRPTSAGAAGGGDNEDGWWWLA